MLYFGAFLVVIYNPENTISQLFRRKINLRYDSLMARILVPLNFHIFKSYQITDEGFKRIHRA